ncbi:MAG: hypothetical protein RMI43_07430 [Candidatus Caldarchaeum sp.]|nr:hypothetical protein [Candidatus Caldarchaeum sp.]MCX8201964.1 hypothetical protein [Candidatus Caldarchaeum sp.]MDW8063986.1 hypothetical protein [Candidatus Caldarchaeum sp.]MDW8434768.1 hypothetical protein [Candidatus Caldarchaeum sp.]
MKIEEIPKVLCIGVSIFSDSLKRQGVEVVDVDWSPPAEIEQDIKDILDKIM